MVDPIVKRSFLKWFYGMTSYVTIIWYASVFLLERSMTSGKHSLLLLNNINWDIKVFYFYTFDCTFISELKRMAETLRKNNNLHEMMQKYPHQPFRLIGHLSNAELDEFKNIFLDDKALDKV